MRLGCTNIDLRGHLTVDDLNRLTVSMEFTLIEGPMDSALWAGIGVRDPVLFLRRLLVALGDTGAGRPDPRLPPQLAVPVQPVATPGLHDFHDEEDSEPRNPRPGKRALDLTYKP